VVYGLLASQGNSLTPSSAVLTVGSFQTSCGFTELSGVKPQERHNDINPILLDQNIPRNLARTWLSAVG
jgi:hypothetical protein